MIAAGLVLLFLFFAPVSADGEPRSYRVVAEKNQVMFEASYPLGDFSGATGDVTGEIRLDPDNIPLGVTGSVAVNPASLRTGLGGRDRDLQNTLEVARYPEIRFRVESVEASFPSLAERVDVLLKIRGVMLIHSVERPMTWTGRARIEEGRIWIRGEAELRLTDFGITPPKKLFLAVADRVRASFDLRLAPKE